MNIGVVVDNDLNNDKRVLREIEILREEGHNVFALCFGFNGKHYADLKGMDVTRIKIYRKLKDTLFFFINFIPAYEWFWGRKIKNHIIENNLDVIHAHDLYMARCAGMGINKSRRNVKLVLDLHENFSYAVTTYNWTKGFLRSIIARPWKWEEKESRYLGFADKIVVLSDEFRDYLLKKHSFLKKENFCSLPNVPDLTQMSVFTISEEYIRFKKKAPLLFYFGIVAERRGIFDAISAFEKVVVQGFDIDFLIIGPVDKKDSKRFNELISLDLIQDRIIYIPWIDLSELPSYLHISDICIAPFHKNPQHESGVANKIYDYMLGKKPLIVSDCEPQRKLVEKHECGLAYIDERDLIEAIIKLLENPELRTIMGENGYRSIIEEFNVARKKLKLVSLYEDLKQSLTKVEQGS